MNERRRVRARILKQRSILGMAERETERERERERERESILENIKKKCQQCVVFSFAVCLFSFLVNMRDAC